MAADFSVESTTEVTFKYEISTGQHVVAKLYKKNCKTSIDPQDIIIESPTPLITTIDGKPSNQLTITHDFNKSQIAMSTIWNEKDSNIELCQVVQLKEGDMVITEDKRQVDIDFDLLVNYTVGNITLGAVTIKAGNDTVDLSSAITAYKCDGISLVCNGDALVPDKDLTVCIKETDPDFTTNSLDSLVSAYVVHQNTIRYPVCLRRAHNDDSIPFMAYTLLHFRSCPKMEPPTWLSLQITRFVLQASPQGGTTPRRTDESQLLECHQTCLFSVRINSLAFLAQSR